MKIAFFAILLLLAATSCIHAQPCLQLDTTRVNVDSAYYDRCSSSATQGSMYCRGHYTLRFDWYVIPTPAISYDTAIVYRWNDIDSRFAAIRAAFQYIASTVGPFTLTKRFASISDTGNRLSHSFILRFDSLLDVDTALALLRTVPNMTVVFNGRPGTYLSLVPSNNGLVPGLDFSNIALDHTTTFTRYMHPLGWQWPVYKLHCPMAWEITMGTRNIHIIGSDQFGTDGSTGKIVWPDPSTNPDVAPNFIQTVASTNPPAGQQFQGDGALSSPLRDGHGHKCISQAIASGVRSLIGTCPQCTGMGLDWFNIGPDSSPIYPDEIDVDGLANGVITVPEIEWVSASGPSTPQPGNNGESGPKSDYTREMALGMAIFSAVGDELYDAGSGQNNNYQPLPSDHSQWLLYPQILPEYGYASFIDGGSDPSKDVHPLAISGTMDGHFWGTANGEACTENVGGSLVRCVGPEEFAIDGNFNPYNFSCGLDKFDISSNITARIQHKQWAFVDVVAPAQEFIMEGIVPEYEPAGYDLDNGASLSAPMVAGIAGLMRSINYYVTPDRTKPTDLADIQRNINTIITFTADKIYDYDNIGDFAYPPSQIIPKGFPETGDEQYVNSTSPVSFLNASESSNMPSWLDPLAAGSGNWQYNYVDQTNDALHRSWAQRVGFGRVNAYRAVANAIPCTGNHLYNTSHDLSSDFDAGNIQNGTQNGNKYLMHFGAWQAPDTSPMDSGSVLQTGGKIIPNQTPPWTYFNQGETLLTSFDGSTATVLTVGDSDILAIDGIVKGDGTANHQITCSGTTGKILITGYLQDVEITGDTTKVDDLIIYSNTTHGYSNVTVGKNEHSEIYGVVQLQDNGNFVVNGGDLTIQPGGAIEMEGNNNFEIESGSVKMMASTTISSLTDQVIIDNGATLEIAGLLPANISCIVHVKPGGMLTIDSGAVLQLDRFLVDSGGTLECIPGGRLTLNQDSLNQCNGNWNFSGTSNVPCIITGGVSICGTVEQGAAVNVNGSIVMHFTDDTNVLITTDTLRDTIAGVLSIVQNEPTFDTAGIKVTIYPDPASNVVKFYAENVPEGIPATLDVIDEMGVVVATLYNAKPDVGLSLSFTIDCSKLPSGIYYADLQTASMHDAVKFSVEH